MQNYFKLLLFIFGLFFISCGKDTTKNRDNQVFRFNQDANVSSLDPAFAKSQDNIWMCNQLFNGLVQLDDSLNIKPDLAKSWTISEDGKTNPRRLHKETMSSMLA